MHAAISLIPVLVLGAALALNFKSEAQRAGSARANPRRRWWPRRASNRYFPRVTP
ncbi:MAG: hypothetical protein JO086_02290 [Acidimicrobiia bacterium]|nr:hypothetical protein [Acidimicrobiia bacterium]